MTILHSIIQILKIKDVAKGTNNFVSASVRNILNEAVKIQALKIILVHNHPSGNPNPSQKDYEFTEKVRKASELLEIQLLDHIVIGDNKYISIFSEEKNMH